MNYFFIALLTTLVSAIVLYFLLNKIMRVRMRVIPLFLCATCSLFLSMALPKVVVRVADWIGVLVVLAVISLAFACFITFYDERLRSSEFKEENEEAVPADGLLCPEGSAVSYFSSSLAVPERENEITEIPVAPQFTYPAMADVIPEQQTEQQLEQQIEQYAEQQPILETEPENEVAAADASCEDNVLADESPDELLDQAFQLKERQEYKAAAKLFLRVLQLNRDSNAAPLVVLEIASAFREVGAFRDAATILTESLGLPAVKGNLVLEQQILSTIAEIKDAVPRQTSLHEDEYQTGAI